MAQDVGKIKVWITMDMWYNVAINVYSTNPTNESVCFRQILKLNIFFNP